MFIATCAIKAAAALLGLVGISPLWLTALLDAVATVACCVAAAGAIAPIKLRRSDS